MKRFLKLLFLGLLALPAIALLVANRHDVIIYLDPFAGPAPEGTQITVQLFVVIGVAIMVGVIFGSGVTYLEQGRYRRAARRARREVVSLRAEVTRLSLPQPGEKRKIPQWFQGQP
jgi:Na+/H+-translocating membrane pyrophosphatase